MTDATSLKPDLGRYGLWTSGQVTPELAVEIQKLGYGTLWLGGSPATQLKFIEPVLENTTNLTVVTGVTIWSTPAKTVAESFHLIDTAYPGRFLLGVGAGHREPYDARPLTSAVSTVYPPKLSDHCPLRAGQCRAVARSLLSPRRIVANGMLAARPLRRLGCSVLMLVTTM
jgi:hypothetical protein